eukprot:SAG22_NODE_2977_length_2056_cov_2.321410_2_plen_49_part_00
MLPCCPINSTEQIAEIVDPAHFKKGLLICLDTESLNGEMVDAVAESKR